MTTSTLRCALIVGALATAAVALHPRAVQANEASVRRVVLAQRFVEARLARTSLRVTVEDHLQNTTDRVVEATVIVPLPRGAAPDALTLMIGGEKVKGDLIRRSDAERVYQRLFRRQRDPAILDYVDRTTLRLRVFPIPARATAVVTYSYTVVAHMRGDGYQIRIPMKAPGFGGLSVKNTSVHVEIDPDVTLGAVYSPTHDVLVDQTGDRTADVYWSAVDQFLDRDMMLLVGTGGDDLAVVTTTGRDRDGRKYFLATVSPPRTGPKSKPVRGEYIFALDASSSVDPAHFDDMKDAVARALASLKPQDRFELMPFSTVPRPVFGKLVAATSENVGKAMTSLEALVPMGRTNLAGALDEIAATVDDQEGHPVVFLATDARSSLETGKVEKLVDRIRDVSGRLRIAAFGFGDRPELTTLETLAEETDGVVAATAPGENAGEQFDRLFGRVRGAGFTDFTLRTSGTAGANEVLPARVSILPGGDRLVVVGRYRQAGLLKLTLRARRGHSDLTREVEIPLGDPETDSGAVARIWAARKVGSLIQDVRRGRGGAAAEKKIRAIGLKFGIVTPYTDFLAIEPAMRGLLDQLGVRATVKGDLSGATAAAAKEFDSYNRNPAVELLRRAQELAHTDSDGVLAFDDLAATADMGRRVGDTTLLMRADGYHCTPDLVGHEIPTDAIRIEAGSDEHIALVKASPAVRPILVAAERVLVVVDGKTYVVN